MQSYLNYWFRGGLKFLLCVILLLPSLLIGSSAIVEWNQNIENDLAGYKVYLGTGTKNYNVEVVDVGKVSQYEVDSLNVGTTYYVAVTAYDQNWNESSYSDEIEFMIVDTQKPTIDTVSCPQTDEVVVVFSEAVDKFSAEIPGNYQIDKGIVIQSASLGTDLKTVTLSTTLHASTSYMLTVNNVRDTAFVSNVIESNTQFQYSWDGTDSSPPTVHSVELQLPNYLQISFSEPLDPASATNKSNYTISPSIDITGSSIDGSFTVVYLNTEQHTPGQQYSLTIENIKDGSDNVITNVTRTYVCQSFDTDPPRLIAVRCSESGTELELEFDEELNQTTAETITNYMIAPSISISNAVLDTTTNTDVILTTGKHQTGTYIISVSGVGDDANPMNMIQTSQEKGYTYSPPDVTSPVLESVEVTSIMGDQLKVTYNEAVEQISATDINNYSIDPPVNVTGASILLGGKEVMLTTDPHGDGNYRLNVSDIKDIAGNTIIAGSDSYKDYTFTTPDLYPPQLSKAELHGKMLIKLFFNETLDPTSVRETSNYTITPDVEIVSASLGGDSNNQVYLDTKEHQAGQHYNIKVHGIRDTTSFHNTISSATPQQAEYDCPVEDTTPPQLVSAELKGGSNSFLELIFSEPLKKETAENTVNYSINPQVGVNQAELINQDRVYITTEAHQRGVDYTITVTGVQDQADNPIGVNNSKIYTCVIEDNLPPNLEKLDLINNQTLNLVFNEPLDSVSAKNLGNYSIDNNITVTDIFFLTQKNVTLVTSPHYEQGTYTLKIQNIKDLASPQNTASEIIKSYTYTIIDTFPPVLLAANIESQTMVELVFNKPLNPSTAIDTSNYNINNSYNLTDVTIKQALLSAPEKVLLETEEHEQGNYTITVNHVESISGVAIRSNSTANYQYYVEDKTPPSIVSVICNPGGENIIVKFSEDMDPSSVSDSSNYAVKEEGIQVNSVSIYSSDEVILSTSTHAPGNYTLIVNGVKDASVNGNSIIPYSAYEYFYRPVDTDGPEMEFVRIHDNNRLELKFNETVDPYDASDTANYNISPDIIIYNAVLDAAELTRVWLTTEPHASGTYTLTVSNIRDRAFESNIISSNNEGQYTYVPADTIPPDLVENGVELRSQQYLALIFDEKLSAESAENIENYTITPQVEVSRASLMWNSTEVHLETGRHDPQKNYVIEIKGIKDRAPIPNEVIEPLRAEYVFTVGDTVKPQLTAAKLQGSSMLMLVFSEPVDQASAQDRDNYSIDPNVEVIDVIQDEANPQYVNLMTTTHFPAIPYSINVRNVKDKAEIPNTIDPNTWYNYQLPLGGGMAVDNISPEVSRIEVISSTRLDVVFSELIDIQTAQNITNYVIDDSVVVESAEIDTNQIRVHLTTSEHNIGESYEVMVNNVCDRATQPNTINNDASIQYILGNGIAVSCLNQADYGLSVFQPNGNCYVDRNYTVTQAPEILNGAVQILTENKDKLSNGKSFLSFELNLDATIFVAFDKNISKIPDWLSGWAVTGDQVVNSRSCVYQLYSKATTGGKIHLGGNQGDNTDNNMYMVFAVPQIAGGALLAHINRKSYQTAFIAANQQSYYVDRDYTISFIPDSLKGLMWIRTANDDKENTDEDFLKFYLYRRSKIYIGYDEQIASLPKWLTSWQKCTAKIVDIIGNRFDLYSKEYSPGELVLGGNCGSTSEDNMYIVLIKPLEGMEALFKRNTLPGYFTLQQNYPNPFNPTTTIEYKVHKAGQIILSVFNIRGQTVKILADREVYAGFQGTAVWDGTDMWGKKVASGVYFYRIQQKNFIKTHKMMLIR
jgi:hypothetical protein